MTKFDKEMGRLKTSVKRRVPVPDDPNKSRKPSPTRRTAKPYTLRVTYPAVWRGKPWVHTQRYATPTGRSQARAQLERQAASRAFMKPISIEEIDE